MTILVKSQQNKIEEIIIQAVEKKLKNYNPETKIMPFHHRIIGKDSMKLFSFIHSVNTMMGTSIFEQIAKQVALPFFKRVECSHTLSPVIRKESEETITVIMNNLEKQKEEPDLERECQALWKNRNKGAQIKKKLRKVDLFLVDRNNKTYFLDIKTAKPSIDQFEKLKHNTLKWIASYYAGSSSLKQPKTFSGLAIPYNPYHPDPYKRWTTKSMFSDEQLLVGEDFWNFLALEQPVYKEVLDCFERVGKTLRPMIDEFARSINTHGSGTSN